MKLELHSRMRYEVDHDAATYNKALHEYYKHLGGIPFPPRSDLLKYFGDSFFHDGTVSSIERDKEASTFRIVLFRLNDLEDINSYRRKRCLEPISHSAYQRRPIRYVCIFSGVNGFRSNVRMPKTVMDSELDYSERAREFRVSLSFGKTRRMSFLCKRAAVRIESVRIIARLTAGLERIPRCALCEEKLLNPGKVARAMEKWSNQAL